MPIKLKHCSSHLASDSQNVFIAALDKTIVDLFHIPAEKEQVKHVLYNKPEKRAS